MRSARTEEQGPKTFPGVGTPLLARSTLHAGSLPSPLSPTPRTRMHSPSTHTTGSSSSRPNAMTVASSSLWGRSSSCSRGKSISAFQHAALQAACQLGVVW